MICSLSRDDKNYSVYLKLYKHLSAVLNSAANNPEATFNIEELVKDMYEKVLAKKDDHELGVRFARMIPTVVLNITAKDSNLRKSLKSKGLEYGALSDMADNTMDSETGISFTENILGTSVNIKNKIEEINESRTSKPKSKGKVSTTPLPEGQIAKEQLLLFDENNNPIIEDVTEEQSEEIKKKGNKVFEAVAPHALKDTDQEALSMDPNSKNYNIPDPAKKMFYKVKRNIIRLLNGGKGSEINLPGVGPVYLRAQSKFSIPESDWLPNTADVILVLVDKLGNQIKFNEEGNVDPNGRIAVYNLPNPYNIDSLYEKKRITAIAETMGVKYDVAKNILIKEKQQVEKVIAYIKQDPSNTVAMDIDGGTFGIIPDAPNAYFLSNVNFPSDAFTIEIIQGNYEFTLPSLSDQSIRLQQMTFAERPELVDLLVNLMVDNVYAGPSELSNIDKKGIVSKYLMLTPSSISIVKAGVKIKDELLDTSTPEAKIAAKEKLKAEFQRIMPLGQPLSSKDVAQRKSEGSKVVTSIEQGRNGDILLSKDLNTGEDVYRVLRQLTLNITSQGLSDKFHFSLSPRPDGTMSYQVIDDGYINLYVKENFKIKKLLNADNQLVALNAYFTFTPLASETTKIDNYNPAKAQEEVDEFTKELREMQKEAQERFDALPREMKMAIEILETANATTPSKNMAYSLHVAKTFENNLKKNLYTREEAEAIVEYLASKEIMEYAPTNQSYKFAGNVYNISKANVQKYTRPTAPEVSSVTTTISENKTFTNSLYRGQEIEPMIDKDGNLVLVVTYDSLFKSKGISFANNEMMAKDYGLRYSKNPYIIEIDADYANQIFPFDPSGGTKSYGKRVTGDENEERFISKNNILIPKGKYKIHRDKRNFNLQALTTRALVDAYNKQFIEDDIAEYNRYGEVSRGYATEGSDYYEAVENELLRRGLNKEDFAFLRKEDPVYSIKEVVANAFNIERQPGELEPNVSNEKIEEYKLKNQQLINILENYQSVQPVVEETSSEVTEIKDPLDTTTPPPSTIEEKRRADSRKADASTNNLKKDNPNDSFLGRPEDKSDDSDELWSTRIQALSSGTITQKDIDTAREWYQNHPLSKYFSFKEAFELINQQNPDSIASWSMNGIVLYKGSDYTQLYHEAFHAFTQSFMSEKQQSELYAEVRKLTGTFMDQNGNMIPFSLATPRQAEEYLAEEFRKYMLSQGKMAIKSAPVRKSFFKKLLNILEVLFGNLTIGEVIAGSNANSTIKDVFDNLRKGDLSAYQFNKANSRFNSLDSTGIQALDSDSAFSSLSKKDTKLLIDSMDGWIAQSIDSANSNLTTEEELEKYLQLQVDMMMNRVSPKEMEKRKIELAPKLTYSQTINFLKTKGGRTLAYKRIENLLSRLQLKLNEEYKDLKSKKGSENELQAIREKLGLVMFARENFGNLDNIDDNKPDSNGVIRGVIALHLAKSQNFGSEAIERLDAEETPDEEKATRDSVGAQDGASVSQKELAKAEVKYIFKTLFAMDPKTKSPMVNELGAPILMDENEVWGKVALILENELDVVKMYNKLLKYAQQEEPTQMSMAIAQLINKLGPKGLDKSQFKHLKNRAVENLWTNFRNVFSLYRIALIAQNIDKVVDDKGKVTIESTIGRGINPYAAVGKSWNSDFIWNQESEYIKHVDGVGNILDLGKVLAKYPDLNSLKTKGKYDVEKVLDFLDAIGIKMSRTAEVKNALEFGSDELGIGAGENGFRWVETLLVPNRKRVIRDNLNKDQNGEIYNEYDRDVKGYSLLEILHKNGVVITKPQDIFNQYKQQLLAGKYKEKDLYMSGLPGEGGNWRELQKIEGQYGSGIPSFMVTTADGNTKFEMSQNSTMTVMISTANAVEDTVETIDMPSVGPVEVYKSAYENLIEMPYMEKFDIDKNPNAKRYVWLTQMFNLVDSNGNLIPKTDPNWGKRKTTTSGKPVKILLHDVSGARTTDKDGVSSASADPYTKFVLDLHLAVQKGLPELMRHSDKATSYSAILNYITSPGAEATKDITQGLYVPNYRFDESREVFHKIAFMNYILPNLVSEHNRVRRFMQKKKDIDAILKQIAQEKKEGKQITPTPVFDFNYLAQGQKFLMFEGLLNSDTKERLSNIEGDLDAYFKDQSNPQAQRLLEDVLSETQNYFEGQFNEVSNLFNQFGFVADNMLETVAKEINNKTSKVVTSTGNKARLENVLLNSWVYNSWINNAESMNFLYGDIALYNHLKEEFHKRNAGIASTGMTYRTDSDWLEFVNETLGRKFEEKLTGKGRYYDGTMNTGVMKDKITRSEYLEDITYNLYKQEVNKALQVNKIAAVKRSEKEIENDIKLKLLGKSHVSREIPNVESLKGIVPDKGSIMRNYYEMNEADAQGWISFDSYRILMDSQGEWTPAQEKIYLAMLAGEEISGDKIGTYFPPIKAQYWGALANDPSNMLTKDVSIEAFHKFQLTPIIPSLTNISPKLKTLHDKMMNEGIDYVLFESGSKVGTLTSVQFDEQGMPLRVNEKGDVLKSTDKGYSETLNIASLKDNIYTDERDINVDVPFTKNVINVQFLKNQLKIEPKWKGKSTFSTQIRKLIEVDLMENGIPTDYLVDEPLETRIEKWFSLDFEEMLKNSDNFKDVIQYEQSVAELTQVKKAQLLKKAKLSLNEDGSVKGDLRNLINYVKSQLTNQEIADHELEFIDVDFNGNLKNDLSFSLAADNIEKLLNALVVKALIRQKVKGESLIQVSGAMTEPQFRAPTEEELVEYGGTNGLEYYTINPDGYINAMKIKIAIQGDFEKLLYLPEVAVFKNVLDTQGNVVVRNGSPVQELDYNESLKQLNTLIKDKNWLNTGDNRKLVSLHGDRIPVQGLNSDEFAEVFEFLPKEAGNIIILPAEIVAKSGGDFDIDKLTLVMPNIGMSSKMVDGKIEYSVSLYSELSQDEYRKRYNKYKEAFAKKYLTDQYTNPADKARALELHFLLNFDVQDRKIKKADTDVFSSVIELALEEGELMTFEEFILSDREKVAQNNLLFAINKLSSRIENYSNLVRPNGIDILDPIVKELKRTYRDYNPGLSTNDEANPSKGIQASKIFEITYNLHKQMTNNLGKKALGIGAVDNTYNELFNRIGLYLIPNNKEINNGIESEDVSDLIVKAKAFYKIDAIKTAKGKEWTKEEQAEWNEARKNFTQSDENTLLKFERQTLFLPHNSLSVKGYKDKAISMSHRYDALGQNKIGDVISQLMNGWVDIAKDPWIFYLRGNDKLGPLLLFLVQAGVPVDHAAYFISQPIITEYMEEVDKLRSVFSEAMQKGSADPITRDKAVLEAKGRILEKLGYTIPGRGSKEYFQNLKKLISRELITLQPEGNMFNKKDLLNQLDIVSDKYNKYDKNGRPIVDNTKIDYSDPQISDFQKAIFLHFLQIADMETAVKDIKLRTNVDTGKSGTLYEAQDKIIKLLELKRMRQDDVNNSQLKYWRIPSDVIDRLIPTIKDAQGNDTGILDESRITSPIASFYQQPFQLEIWKDLFPFRNNSTINRYLIDLPFNDKDLAKNKTYFKDDIELMSEFKSALLPIIFQNSFLTYDVSKLKNPTETLYYRGQEVEQDITLQKVEALPEWGAVYKDGILYYDYNTLWAQYNNKSYLSESKSGVAPINSADTFNSFGEYVKFIFEREYIRSQYTQDTFTQMTQLRRSNPEFNAIWKSSLNAIKRDSFKSQEEWFLDKESRKEFERARLKYSFEIFIRNKALKNVYNLHALFNGETSYAYELLAHKIDKSYGTALLNAFPILKNLTPDSETSKTSKKERVNLAYLDTPKDSDTINSYYYQIQALSNPIQLKKAIPSLSNDQAQNIADTFKKLPIVAFLQSGMNTKGRFSLTRIVDNSSILAILLPEVKNFIQKIETESDKQSSATLQSMFNAFVEANKSYDARGKKYVIPVKKDADPASTLDNKLFIDSVDEQKSFDPAFINSKGELVKPYSKIGDTVKFSTDKATYNNAVINNITWNRNQIVVDVEVTLSDGKTGMHQFFYAPEGRLLKYVTATGATYVNKVNELIDTNDTIIVSPQMLSSLPEYSVEFDARPGDMIISEYTKKGDTKKSTSEQEIVELESIGYNFNRIDGQLQYTSDTPLYRLKTKFNFVKDNKTVEGFSNVIVDSNGNVVASINANGTLSDYSAGNRYFINLRSDRVKGQFITLSLSEASQMAQQGIIPPGAIVDVMSQEKQPSADRGFFNRSNLVYLDASTNQWKKLNEVYTGVEKPISGFDVDGTNYFIVYNEAVNPGVSLAATGNSSVPLPKGVGPGNIDFRDRYVHHSDFQNKAGVISRNKYRGGSILNPELLTEENIGQQEFFYDVIDEFGKPTINPDVKAEIDKSIDIIVKMRDDKGLMPVFNKSGYGQYMIGADDTTGKMLTDKNGNKVGIATAPETFKYLSTRLLEEFGYINPNFVKEAEGVKEVVRVMNQPITDEEYSDLMNKCFA